MSVLCLTWYRAMDRDLKKPERRHPLRVLRLSRRTWLEFMAYSRPTVSGELGPCLNGHWERDRVSGNEFCIMFCIMLAQWCWASLGLAWGCVSKANIVGWTWRGQDASSAETTSRWLTMARWFYPPPHTHTALHSKGYRLESTHRL